MSTNLHPARQSLPGLAKVAPAACPRFTHWLLAGLLAGLLAVEVVRLAGRSFTLLTEGLGQVSTPNLHRPV